MTDEFLIKTSYLAEIFSLYNEADKRREPFHLLVEQSEQGGRYLMLWPDSSPAPWRSFRRRCTHFSRMLMNMSQKKHGWWTHFSQKEEDVEYLQVEDELMDIKSNSLFERFYAEHASGFGLLEDQESLPDLHIMRPPDSSCHLSQPPC